ncbi:MAG: hypothetical protein ABSF64_35105 [Bryobacteraceae bacterium]
MLTIAMERAERFDRKIKARNLRECLAAVLVAAFFAFVAWKSPNALARAGHLVVAASGLWIVFCMLRYGREAPPPAPDRSAADFERALLRKYDHQIRLLKNVKYWYLLPPYVGLLLASAGIVMANRAAGQPAWPQLASFAVYTACSASSGGLTRYMPWASCGASANGSCKRCRPRRNSPERLERFYRLHRNPSRIGNSRSKPLRAARWFCREYPRWLRFR